MRPHVDEALCVTCAACEDVCPAEPHVFAIEAVATVVHPEACIGCKACQVACPTDAIVVQ